MTNFCCKPALYGLPETAKPRDITIGAASKTGVKLTPIELTANHSIANS